MRLRLQIPGPERLEVPLLRILKGLPEDQPYFSENSRRHPYAIVVTSLSSVLDSFSRLVEPLEMVEFECSLQERAGENYVGVLREFRNLLQVIESFDDAMDIVVSSFYPSRAIAKKSRVYMDFCRIVGPFRRKLGRTINPVKHENCRLQPVFMHDWRSEEYLLAAGYMVEGVHPGGVIGPHIGTHCDGNSGFSLIRDVRYYFSHVFFLMHWVHEAVRVLVPDAKSAVGPEAAVWTSKHFETVARTISNSRLRMLPNEAGMKVPEVYFYRDGSNSGVAFSFAESKKPPVLRGGQIVAMTAGDGVSRSFKLPYFGEGVRKKKG